MSTGRQPIEIDLQAMEDLIADPSNTMDAVGMLLGVSAETIYARKNRDKGFNRAYERGQLRREAACIHSNGSSKDAIVLSAIRLGFGTRRELKEALGFGYDVIEKAIERNSGEIKFKTTGQIERFEFIVGNLIVEALPDSQPKNKPSGDLACERCGGPRSVGSAKHCKKCYRRSVSLSEQDIVRAGQLRAEGKTMEHIAAAFGINNTTLSNYRNKHPALEAALVAGHQEYYRSGEQEEIRKERKLQESAFKPEPESGIVVDAQFEEVEPIVESTTIQDVVITELLSDKGNKDISTLESAIEVLKKERAELDVMIHMLEKRITRYCSISSVAG